MCAWYWHQFSARLCLTQRHTKCSLNAVNAKNRTKHSIFVGRHDTVSETEAETVYRRIHIECVAIYACYMDRIYDKRVDFDLFRYGYANYAS